MPPTDPFAAIASHTGASIDFEQTSATYNHDKACSYWNWIRLWNYAQPPDVILEAGGMAGQGESGRGVARGLGAGARGRGWGESAEGGGLGESRNKREGGAEAEKGTTDGVGGW